MRWLRILLLAYMPVFGIRQIPSCEAWLSEDEVVLWV